MNVLALLIIDEQIEHFTILHSTDPGFSDSIYELEKMKEKISKGLEKCGSGSNYKALSAALPLLAVEQLAGYGNEKELKLSLCNRMIVKIVSGTSTIIILGTHS